MKYFLILLFLIISHFWTTPAEAKNCQYWHNREICFGQIKRSAKYYWEYRATVTIDGIKQTPTIYNCRTKEESPKKGRSTPFISNGVGALICSSFDKK